MKLPPKFSLSSLLLCTGSISIGIAIAMNVGAFGLLLSAIATLVLLSLFVVAIFVLTSLSDASAISHPIVKLAATYCAAIAFYFASYGPATWLLASLYTHDSQPEILREIHADLYSPVTRCIVDSPVRTIHYVGVAYLKWWLPSDVDFFHRGRSIGWYTESKVNPSFGTSVGLTPPLIG